MKRAIDSVLLEWLGTARDVVYYPNPGNAGDALIAAATWQVFDRLGIHPQAMRPPDFPEDADIILGGGGNLVPYYQDMRFALERCLERGVRKCLLLPHSIRGHEDLLGRLDGRFTLCCRELPSYEYAKVHASRARVVLLDDMAVGMDFEALRARTSTVAHRIALLFDKDWRKYRRKWRRALARCHPDKNGMLTVMRSDLESVAGVRGERAYDLPRHYEIQGVQRAGCEQVARDIADHLCRARVVVTDRLHMAIPAMILGVTVKPIDNVYSKLSSVIDHSFSGMNVSVARDDQNERGANE